MPNYKDENLDSSAILAVLHIQQRHSGILALTDDRVLATTNALEVAFAELYDHLALAIIAQGGITITKINQPVFRSLLIDQVKSVARPDVFSNAIRQGQKTSARGSLGRKILAKLRVKGSSFLAVIQKFTPTKGHLSEQFDRTFGAAISAVDLAWSYAGLLSAMSHRPTTSRAGFCLKRPQE